MKQLMTYSGAKSRIADKVVDILLDGYHGQLIYDVCCGAGSITTELLRRGVWARKITMVDASHFGAIFAALADGSFSIPRFTYWVNQFPRDPAKHHLFLQQLIDDGFDDADRLYLSIFFQAASYRGVQVDMDNLQNMTVNEYRMKPSDGNHNYCTTPSLPVLRKRIVRAAMYFREVNVFHGDAMRVQFPPDSIIYIDPPYQGTAGYHYSFNLQKLIDRVPASSDVYVSEARPLTTSAWLVDNISGRDEYVSLFRR